MSCDTAVEPVARSQIQRPRVARRIRWNTVTSMSWPIRNAVIEPPMVHSPCPNTLANAACMSGTPRDALTVTHHAAGASPMATYAATKA